MHIYTTHTNIYTNTNIVAISSYIINDSFPVEKEDMDHLQTSTYRRGKQVVRTNTGPQPAPPSPPTHLEGDVHQGCSTPQAGHSCHTHPAGTAEEVYHNTAPVLEKPSPRWYTVWATITSVIANQTANDSQWKTCLVNPITVTHLSHITTWYTRDTNA